MSERPDGSQATTIGWVLVAVGVVAAFIASSAETTQGLIIAVAVANLGIGLGIILLSLGYFVRAIWFLPGREGEVAEVRAEQTSEDESNGFHYCDWCHLGFYAPDLACSRQSDDQIRADFEQGKMQREACAHELDKRGYAN